MKPNKIYAPSTLKRKIREIKKWLKANDGRVMEFVWGMEAAKLQYYQGLLRQSKNK